MTVLEMQELKIDKNRHVYEAVASLFDTNTVVDINDEYHRGVVETLMRVVGIDSDYKNEIAEVLTEFNKAVDHTAFAKKWIRMHGANVYPGIASDIHFALLGNASDVDIDIIIGLLENAEIDIKFP